MTDNYEFSKFLANERYGFHLDANNRYHRLHEADDVRHKTSAKQRFNKLAGIANALFHHLAN